MSMELADTGQPAVADAAGTKAAKRWRFSLGYHPRKILTAFPLILGVITVNFFLIHMAPGDPVSVLVGEFAPSKEELAELYAKLGLDQPLYVQYLKYLGSVLRGDLGYSYVQQAPVVTLIVERIPATASLMLSALILFTILGVFLAVLVSNRLYSWADNFGSFIAIIGYSVPVFFLGQMVLVVFGLNLRWFPTNGMTNARLAAEGFDYFLDVLYHLILPTLVLGTRYLAINFRFARASMIEALSQDYIVAAKAKGLSEARIRYHAFRNAILPVITVLGVNFGDILAGAVLTEIVFGWPGLGRLMYNAMFARDYPLLLGMFVFISIGIIITNLVIDLVYGLVDPRVRHR